jgi:hypothetical protein
MLPAQANSLPDINRRVYYGAGEIEMFLILHASLHKQRAIKLSSFYQNMQEHLIPASSPPISMSLGIQFSYRSRTWLHRLQPEGVYLSGCM